LANGTLAHCLDFDDTYVKAVTHVSAPVWAATLTVGEEVGADEAAMLSAFVAGFETASRLGSGLGEAVTARGWHSTGVFGRLGAAAASAALLRLDTQQALHALGAAATQTGGLTASFGTLAKQITGGKSGAPASPLEGKFDLKYCIALGLHGQAVSAADFREPWHPDPAVCATAGKVESIVSPDMGFASARLAIDFADGR